MKLFFHCNKPRREYQQYYDCVTLEINTEARKYHLFYDKPEPEWMDDYIIVDNQTMSYLMLSAAMDGYEHSDIV